MNTNPLVSWRIFCLKKKKSHIFKADQVLRIRLNLKRTYRSRKSPAQKIWADSPTWWWKRASLSKTERDRNRIRGTWKNWFLNQRSWVTTSRGRKKDPKRKSESIRTIRRSWKNTLISKSTTTTLRETWSLKLSLSLDSFWIKKGPMGRTKFGKGTLRTRGLRRTISYLTMEKRWLKKNLRSKKILLK